MRGPGEHGLTAGYAVDALEPDEVRAAERHLAECEDCRRDLAEFRETTVRLARGEATEPRERVWESILVEARGTRQLPPVRSRPAGRSPRSPSAGRWLPWSLAAVLALFSVVLTGTLVSVQERLAVQEAQNAEMETLLAAADTDRLDASVGEGRATLFASYDEDAAILLVEGLPEAPADMTYRMWWVDGNEVRPAGMLKPSGEGRYMGMAGEMGSPEQLWISLEPLGEAAEPSGEEYVIDM
ncbi:anti-sigma factor [Nocardiopsis lambiniae]|uniref:Regulator of SigK n=1 Tax=Nocardiopsis lambiniae TaxID=3075539 RepID=A0ABU2MAQ6_9ACTN|nr:anti-sigma factor [Nocardiopsis sp. DSM 44743]MDT0329665.1 anti-sigma factor [Nocardiopsis sp. DSM 44743]